MLHVSSTRFWVKPNGVTIVAILATIVGFQFAHARNLKPKFETRFTLAPSYSFEDLGQGTRQTSVNLISESEFSLRYRKDWRLRLTPLLQGDPASPSESERFLADFNEASIEWRGESVRFRAGIIPYAWGATDVFNPLDVVGSRRYWDPLNPDRRGSPSVSLQHEFGGWRWEAIYIPMQLPSILPGEQSRWLPRDVAVNRSSGYEVIQLPEELRYHYRDVENINGALNNNYGIQLEHHGDGVDASAVFFEGAPTAPVIFTEATGRLVSTNPDVIVFDPDVDLRPKYYRKRTAGVSLVGTFASSIVRMAAAYNDRVGEAAAGLPGWSQAAVLGFEQSVGIGSSTLVLLLQGTYAHHEDRPDNSSTSLERIFDRSWLLGLRLATESEWIMSVAILNETLSPSWLGQLKIDKRLADGLQASFSVDSIEGPTGSALGTYRRNERLGLALTAYW